MTNVRIQETNVGLNMIEQILREAYDLNVLNEGNESVIKIVRWNVDFDVELFLKRHKHQLSLTTKQINDISQGGKIEIMGKAVNEMCL